MISRVEVAVATTLSLASKTSAEAKATRRPGFVTLPTARSLPESTVTGRR
jgi:hypothetical protein